MCFLSIPTHPTLQAERYDEMTAEVRPIEGKRANDGGEDRG